MKKSRYFDNKGVVKGRRQKVNGELEVKHNLNCTTNLKNYNLIYHKLSTQMRVPLSLPRCAPCINVDSLVKHRCNVLKLNDAFASTFVCVPHRHLQGLTSNAFEM